MAGRCHARPTWSRCGWVAAGVGQGGTVARRRRTGCVGVVNSFNCMCVFFVLIVLLFASSPFLQPSARAPKSAAEHSHSRLWLSGPRLIGQAETDGRRAHLPWALPRAWAWAWAKPASTANVTNQTGSNGWPKTRSPSPSPRLYAPPDPLRAADEGLTTATADEAHRHQSSIAWPRATDPSTTTH